MLRVFVTSLALLISLSAQSIAAQDQKLTGDQIIQKHLEAVGGREALAKLKSRIALGTIRKEDEPDSQWVVMSEAPNRVAAFYGFKDYGDLFLIYDGSKAIIRPVMRRNLAPIMDKYQTMLASGLMFNSVSLYNLLTSSDSAALSPEAKGTKKVAGRPAYVVQVKTGKETMKLYFDTETFMWVRTDYGKADVSATMRNVEGNTAALNQNRNQGGSETTIDFYIETSDFREVDGVKLPFKLVQVITAPILRKSSSGTITGTIREYRHNEPIDPKMFQ